MPQVEIAIKTSHKSIFIDGINALVSNNHDHVYIYAPTGVWEPDKDKAKWFWTLAICLVNALPENDSRQKLKSALETIGTNHNYGSVPTTRLASFIGIYGMPPVSQPAKFTERLDNTKELLSVFEGIPTAVLYYLKVDTGTIPGTGTIIIDNSIFWGIARAHWHKVDFGIFMQQQTEIAQALSQWFSFMTSIVVSRNVIQELSNNGVTLKKGLEQISNNWKRRLILKWALLLLAPSLIAGWIVFLLASKIQDIGVVIGIGQSIMLLVFLGLWLRISQMRLLWLIIPLVVIALSFLLAIHVPLSANPYVSLAITLAGTIFGLLGIIELLFRYSGRTR